MTVPAPSNLSYGKVVWQTVSDIVDGSDPDVTPDFIAPTGTVTFVASMVAGRDISATPNPVTVVRDPITGILDEDGYLCTPDPANSSLPGARGVWLIATDDPDLNPVDWVYNVTYSIRGANNRPISLKSHQIYVPTYTGEGDVVDLTTVGPVDNADQIGIPAAEAAAAAAIAAAAEAAASAAAAEAALIDSAEFVGDEIATDGTPAEVAVAAKITDGIEAAAPDFATAVQGGKADSAVQPTRTINGKPLSANVTLSPTDVGAATATQGTKADAALPSTSLDSSGATLIADETSAMRTALEAILEAAYTPEANAYFNRMSVRPNSDRRRAIDTLIRSLQSSGVWSKLEGLHLLASHNGQAGLLNVMSSSGDLTAVNSPAFTVDRGYTGDGVSAYLTGPTRSYTKFLPESLMQSVWTLSGTANDNMFDVSGPYARVNPRNNSGQLSFRANQGSTSGVAHGGLPGLFTITRPSSTASKAYRNGSLLLTTALASSTTTPSTAAMLGLRYTSTYSDRLVSLIAYGGALSDAETASFYNTLNAYMVAVGVVLP